MLDNIHRSPTETRSNPVGTANLPAFWQFVGLGDEDYGVLQRS